MSAGLGSSKALAGGLLSSSIVGGGVDGRRGRGKASVVGGDDGGGRERGGCDGKAVKASFPLGN